MLALRGAAVDSSGARQLTPTEPNQKRLGCITLVGALFLLTTLSGFEATPLYDVDARCVPCYLALPPVAQRAFVH